MNRKLWRVGLVTLFALLLSGGIVALARGSAPQDVVVPYPSQSPAAPAMVAGTMYTPTTVITVTSTSDPDSGGSNTCYTTPGVGQTAYPLTCTLRRAIVEASSMDPISRPVLIKFNIPVADSGYTTDPAAYPDGVWRIVLDSTPGWDLPVVKGGGVIIDGDTQVAVGGRSDGPKIIIEGQDLQIGNVLSGVDDGNLVRGLALQGGGIHLGSHKNIIEDNSVFIPIAIGDRNRFRKSGKFQMLWLKMRNYRKTEHNRSLIGN